MPVASRSVERACRPRAVPRWDADAAELWWHGRLIKRFRKAADAQGALLDAFAASGWPRFLSNPLSTGNACNRKMRLRWTVRNLNVGLLKRTIRFTLDGRGRVEWSPADP